MPRGPVWTERELLQLFDMRERQRMIWADIAAALGRVSGNACHQAYAGHRKNFPDEIVLAERPTFASHLRPLPVNLEKLLAEPVKRPRYFSDMDGDVMKRIRAQGLTAGYFGDPPPGRSALDQRQRQP